MKEVFVKERKLKSMEQNECLTIDIDEMKVWKLGDRVSIAALNKAGILRTGLYVLAELVGMKQISVKDAAYPKVRYQFRVMANPNKF